MKKTGFMLISIVEAFSFLFQWIACSDVHTSVPVVSARTAIKTYLKTDPTKSNTYNAAISAYNNFLNEKIQGKEYAVYMNDDGVPENS